jgi:hypothetical protein
MFWIIPISVAVVTLLWLVFGPVIIFVNTRTSSYHLALPGIFKAAVVPSGELVRIRGWIFFIPFSFDPFNTGSRKKKRPTSKKAWPRVTGGLTAARNLPRAFRIRKLHLNIDTDDVILNARLVPVFSAINTEEIRLQANFEGNTSLVLDVRTRLGAILWVFIKTKYKSMFNQ